MSGRTINLPTPNKGLNYVDSITTMDIGYCLECTNFFPTPTTLQLRSGFDIYQTFGTLEYLVRTLITYNETNGDTIIFACIKNNQGKFYIVDKSERTTVVPLINDFPINSYYLKYIVSNNLFTSSNNTKADTVINSNLVLGVYTSIDDKLAQDKDYSPIYLQNNNWGVYNVIPVSTTKTTTATSTITTVPFNPTKIITTISIVPSTNNKQIKFNLTTTNTSDTFILNAINYLTINQIYIIQVNNQYVRVKSVGNTSIQDGVTIICERLDGTPFPSGATFGDTVIMQRYLMFDTAVFNVNSFKPIAITQIAGFTAMVFRDNFILYLIPQTGFDSFSTRYQVPDEIPPSPDPPIKDTTYNAPTIVSFGYNVKFGGNVVDIDNYTVDSGNGQQDYLCIFISTGEILTFSMAASIPTFVASYRSGDIFAPNCTVKLHGDLVFLSNQGLDSMNRLIGSTRVETKPMLSYAISYKLSQDINTYKNNKGWDIVYYQPTNMLIINVPTSEETAFQYVMNTTTYAWTRFTNINALCFGQTANSLFFGNDLIYILFYDKDNNKITYDVDIKSKDVHTIAPIAKWDSDTVWDKSVWGFDSQFGYRTTIGGLDGAYFIQAFTNLNSSNRKKINLVKPNIYNYSLVYDFKMGLGSDFIRGDYTPYDIDLISPNVGYLTPPVFVSDDPNLTKRCTYNNGFTFGDNQISIPNAWFNLPAFGFAISFQFSVQAFLNDFEYTSTDIVYELSNNII